MHSLYPLKTFLTLIEIVFDTPFLKVINTKGYYYVIFKPNFFSGTGDQTQGLSLESHSWFTLFGV